MSNLSLNQIFGAGVTQDINTLTIQKSSLNITPLSTNTAESLLITILVKAMQSLRGELTDPSENKVTDIDNNPITYDQTPLYDFLDVFLWKLELINGYKIYRIVSLEYQLYVD